MKPGSQGPASSVLVRGKWEHPWRPLHNASHEAPPAANGRAPFGTLRGCWEVAISGLRQKRPPGNYAAVAIGTKEQGGGPFLPPSIPARSSWRRLRNNVMRKSRFPEEQILAIVNATLAVGIRKLQERA